MPTGAFFYVTRLFTNASTGENMGIILSPDTYSHNIMQLYLC